MSVGATPGRRQGVWRRVDRRCGARPGGLRARNRFRRLSKSRETGIAKPCSRVGGRRVPRGAGHGTRDQIEDQDRDV